MDIDARKRLQVLNQTNPSIRTVAAPAAPKVTVDVAGPQNLRVGNTNISQTSSVQAAPTPKGNIVDFVGGVGVRGGGGILRDFARTPGLVRLAKPVLPTFIDKKIDTIQRGTDNFVDKNLSDAEISRALSRGGEDVTTRTKLGQKGAKVGSITKGVADVAGITQGVAELPSILRGAKAAVTGVPKALAGIRDMVSGATSGANEIAKVIKKGNLDDIVKVIAKQEKPAAIKKALGVDSDVAKYLASETNPEAVRSVIQGLDDGKSSLKVFDAMNPDPRHLPEGYITHAEDNARKAAQKAKPEDVFTTTEGVKAAKDPEVGDFVKGKITQAKLKDLVPGNGVDMSAPLDDARVAQYIDDIANGKPIPPVVIERGDNGITFVQDGRHRLAALEALGIEDAPVIEKTGAKLLADKATGPILGEGFSMTDKVNPAMVDAGKQIKSIDKKLEKVRAGKSNLSADEVRNLVSEREAIINKTQNAGSGVSDAVAKSPTETPKPATPTNSADNLGEATAQGATKNTADIPNSTAPAPEAAVQEVLGKLDEASSAASQTAKLYSQQRAQKFAAGKANAEAAGGGLTGYKAKLGALKGKMKQADFQHIEASPDTVDALLKHVDGMNLMEGEKLNTQTALLKIFGLSEGNPTPGDINNIRKAFGDNFADAVEQAAELTTNGGWREKATQIAGTPRALMATGDLSYGLRQGAPLGARFPKQWAKAQGEAVKYAKNSQYFDDEMKAISSAPDFEVISKKMGVHLPGADAGTEEAFAAADIAEKIPGINIGVKAADRAYSGMATKLRYESAKTVVDAAGGPDQYLKIMQDTYGDKADDAMRAFGEVINTLSGRGGKKGGLVDAHMKTLSTTLFAPRLWAAKLNTLNPAWYARLAKTNPDAAKLAVRANATFLAMAGGVLSAAAAAGADVEWDPRSADFAKIKVGNTRYDILGGLQQNIRLGAQLFTGQKINSETGKLDTLGDGFTAKTRKDILYDFFENKENPLLSFATKLLEGKDQGGNPVNPLKEAGKLAIPLGVQGSYETSKDLGNPVKGTAMNIPGFFGIGVQTYGKTATKDKGAPATSKSIEDQIQGMKDGKKTTVEEFTKSLSKDDQSLLKASATERKALLENGTIDQEHFDRLKSYDQVLKNMKGENTVPEGVTSPNSTSFYKKFNSLDENGKKKYLSGSPDATSKAIATDINKNKPKGLEDYKASNELSKAYAEYEKDIATHPEYTAVDKRNKAKAFQTYGYKLNYSTDQRDLYAEGPSTDLKTLLANGEVAKADLDQAIKLDNELYASGLTDSLKFSKKFRTSYGYGVPASRDGESSGTKSTKISSLLPSFSSSSSSAPSISARPRSFKIKSPSTGSGKSKKINIKL